ncbi:uncharacterized protein LOC133392261 [Anopheles gambiae]|uniref:uncharacterized protein LOC133392261 n=1 Tax=Anopheles gambiae TaxID=7165 RepID=UPI002AC9A292|nr:uncharacterized protein LOC133392261 [Anopheles gambiae]XP_061508329.1 uncharacterized protein LOC133392261 [Anopheles gambiae]
MIRDIIVADRLHLIDLGIMKRLLLGWRDGKLGIKAWNKQQIELIDKALDKIRQPSEVHRKQRPIKYIKYWKASECAFFLHYPAIAVLKDHLPQNVYKHFLLLFCAITILSTRVYKQKWPLAGQLLDKFVADFPTVYNERYMTSNIHNLQHVFEDVDRFGPLSEISTYPFENMLQYLKNLLRSGWKNLEQAINRLSELDEFEMPMERSNVKYPTICTKGKITTVHVRENFNLQNNDKNCWFLTKDCCIIKFKSTNTETVNGGRLSISGQKLAVKGLAFSEPFDSSELFIFKGNTESLENYRLELNTDFIKCKLVCIKGITPNDTMFIPLVHTLI